MPRRMSATQRSGCVWAYASERVEPLGVSTEEGSCEVVNVDQTDGQRKARSTDVHLDEGMALKVSSFAVSSLVCSTLAIEADRYDCSRGS